MESNRKPGDSFKDRHESTMAGLQSAVPATDLTHGTVYTGKIIAREPDGNYTVRVIDPEQTLHGVRLAFPVLGGLLGLNVMCNLPERTSVKLVHGRPPFIIATIPELPEDFRNARNRSLLWGPDADTAVGVTDGYSYHANDLLEGEVEISNLYGVALDFLTTLMRMRAGDRAMVECHMINDMVRIISGQYRHISGLGEDLIYDHGRPTLERTW
jgi:5-methylthioribose kinase